MSPKTQFFPLAIAKGILLITIITSSFQENQTNEIAEGPTPSERPQDLTYLGTVDGKAFFYDGHRNTWSGAKTYCANSQLKLAKVETKNEANFLKEALHQNGYINKWMWLDAREVHNVSMIIWEDNKKQLDISEIDIWDMTPSHYWCVLFSVDENNSTHMYAQNCAGVTEILCTT